MSAAPTPVPAGGTRRRRKLLIVLGTLVAGAAIIVAVAAAMGWGRPRPKQPPDVELSGLDDEVAAAIRTARAAVVAQPNSADAWGRLGRLLLAHDMHVECMPCFEEAERLDPADASWPYHQGCILMLARPDEAIAPLRRAAERAGNEVAPRLRLAEILLALDRPDEAEPLFRELLRDYPDNPRVHLGLGLIAYRRDELRESLPDLRAAANSPYSRREARAALAAAYERLGNAEAAAEERRVLADLPADPPWPDSFAKQVESLQTGLSPRVDQAGRLLNSGRVPEAIALLRDVLRDYPESDQAHGALATAYLYQRNLPAAEAELVKVVRLDPQKIEGHLQLGEVRAARKDEAGAEACYRKVIELKPDHAQAHYNLGQCRLRQHDPAGAADAFRAALRYRPDLTDAHVALAELLLEQGHPAEARDHLEDALRLAPKHEKANQLMQKAKQNSPRPSGERGRG
jgi:tetratricopeptide (TPR) repeat protein